VRRKKGEKEINENTGHNQGVPCIKIHDMLMFKSKNEVQQMDYHSKNTVEVHAQKHATSTQRTHTSTATHPFGQIEARVKGGRSHKDVRQQEVQHRPELMQVVLHGSARKEHTGAGADLAASFGDVGALVLDFVALVEDYGPPPLPRQRMLHGAPHGHVVSGHHLWGRLKEEGELNKGKQGICM
jgi:hypothetical protein